MSLTSVIRYVEALDTSATDGSGKTGIAFGSFTASYLVQGGTLTSLTTETITTLGTYQAPSDAAHIRIKELAGSDPTKGIYEVHFHNTQVVSTGVKLWLFLSATGAKVQRLELDLSDLSGRLPAALTSDGIMKADALRQGGGLLPPPPGVIATVNDAGATTTGFIGSSGLSAVDDFYNGAVLAFTSGALAGLARKVSDYTGATKTFAFSGGTGSADAAWPAAPANAASFVIIGRIG